MALMRRVLTISADRLGIWASTLCILHCIVAPVVVSLSVVSAHFLPSEEWTPYACPSDRDARCSCTYQRIPYSPSNTRADFHECRIDFDLRRFLLGRPATVAPCGDVRYVRGQLLHD